jgi:hypothetical protein
MRSPAEHRGPGARALYLGTRDTKTSKLHRRSLGGAQRPGANPALPTGPHCPGGQQHRGELERRCAGAVLAKRHWHQLDQCQRRSLGTCYPHRRSQPALCQRARALAGNCPRNSTLPALAARAAHGRAGALGQTVNTTHQPLLWERTKREWVYARQFRVHLPPPFMRTCWPMWAASLQRRAPPLLWDFDAESVDLDHDLCELLWAEMNLCTGDLADTTTPTKKRLPCLSAG